MSKERKRMREGDTGDANNSKFIWKFYCVLSCNEDRKL